MSTGKLGTHRSASLLHSHEVRVRRANKNIIRMSTLFIRAWSKSHKPLRRLKTKIGENYRILVQVGSTYRLPAPSMEQGHSEPWDLS